MTLVANRIDAGSIPEFTLRKKDVLECAAAGFTPEAAVKEFVSRANAAYAHYIDGDLVCLWGYRWEEYSTKSAVMWLLSCEGADKHKLAYGRATKHLLGLLQEQLATIKILVHVKYAKAIVWLKWLGFEYSQTLTEDFIEMKKERV